ncbi:MAG: hypothetical protein ACRD3W_01355 [Terriglobales bacterium]
MGKLTTTAFQFGLDPGEKYASKYRIIVNWLTAKNVTETKLNHSRFLALLLFLCLLTCLRQSALSAEQHADTLVLTQSCTVMRGTTTVFLAPNGGIRIENGDVITFTNPPKWDVTVVNPKGKVFCQSDFKSGLSQFAATRTTLPEEFASTSGWIQSKSPSILGLSTQHYGKGARHGAVPSAVQEYWTFADTKLAPSHSAQLLATQYGLPILKNELPLKFVYFGSPNDVNPMIERHIERKDTSAHMQLWLSTTGVKRIPFDKNLFSIPTNCKKASLGHVLTSRNIESDFIFKDLLKHPDALFDSR